MDINDIIEKLFQDEEYKTLFDKLERHGEYDKGDALTILLAISYMQSGNGVEAEALLAPLLKRHSERADMRYWHASALLIKAESLEDFIEAKGEMLDALTLSLDANMRDDAIRKLGYAEEKIDLLMNKKN